MIKAGILGGGQLGRMLLQAAANYPVETFVMENDPECPAAHLCHHFTKGLITDFDSVYEFGKGLDVLTIEIESVNVEALKKLEEEGVKIYPSPAALEIIRNKAVQKQFYKQHDIPTSDFIITRNQQEVTDHAAFLPAAHKLALGGYDGKGVQLLKTSQDLHLAFAEESVLEKLVDIKKELAIIIAINEKGETAIYPPVEMMFNAKLNLLEYQICPAEIDEKIVWKAEAIALAVVKNLETAGIFAVELFVDMEDQVLVNETAPRVHNSGHHTIEGNFSSQFDMLWRVMLGYPLGNTSPIMNSAIVNIIGEDGYSGEAVYEGLDELLSMDHLFLHLYGKKETRPGRKMGHVTILSNERQQLMHVAGKVKKIFKVTGKQEAGL